MNKGLVFFYAGTVLLFLSALSFFTVSSAYADDNNLNGVFLTSGIVLGLLSLYAFFQTKKVSN